LLGRRPPTRLSQLAELPILPRQVPLEVRNRRLKPDDVDVRRLRNEFGNLSPEFDELELFVSDSRSSTFPIPISVVAPSVAARNTRKLFSEACERTWSGVLRSFGFSRKSSHVATKDRLGIWNVWPSKTSCFVAIVIWPVW
jgi:hypothetical protein